MFEIQKDGEEDPALEVFAHEHASDRVEEKSEKKSVVLEVDVIHEDQSRVGHGQQEHLAVEPGAIRGLGQAPEHGHTLVACPGSIGQHEITQDDGQALEEDRLVGVVVEVGHLDHLRIEMNSQVGEGKLPPSEQRWVV